MKKKRKIYTKTNGHTWKSPFSAPCPGLFPTTLRSSVLSFLLRFPPYSFPHFLSENSSVLLRCYLLSFPLFLRNTPPFFHWSSQAKLRSPSPPLPFFLFFLSFYLGFAFTMISAAATFSLPHSFCSHLFCLRDPSSESSSTCQSPTAASKSEVDSLWSLRM